MDKMRCHMCYFEGVEYEESEVRYFKINSTDGFYARCKFHVRKWMTEKDVEINQQEYETLLIVSSILED